MPAISVILPTRDRGGLLLRAAHSVLAQTESDFELLVVDNNRAEPPVSASREHGSWTSDPRVRVLRAPEVPNAAAARNVALRQAAGDWISFLDDDDAYQPDKLRAQHELARSTAAPLVLCGATFHVAGRHREQQTAVSEVRGDALLTDAWIGAPFLFHCRHPSVGFDESLFAGEDFHYAHRLIAAWRMTTVPVVPRPLVDVFQHGAASDRTNLRADAAWRAVRKTWWEHGPRYSPAARRVFVVRAIIARAKLKGEVRRVVAWLPVLFRCGGRRQLRYALNALAVSAGWFRGRWVT